MHKGFADQLESRDWSVRLGNLPVIFLHRSQFKQVPADWVQLVRAIAAGDQAALHALYERTHRLVFTLAVRIIANRESAEEVTIDVFHDLWRKAFGYDPADGSVLGWIMNQARCRAIDRVRFEKRKKRNNTYPDSLLPTTDIVDPQQATIFKEESGRLETALDELTPHERHAIEAAFFSELTYAEVAQRLNQPLGTVKTRIRSGPEQTSRRTWKEEAR